MAPRSGEKYSSASSSSAVSSKPKDLKDDDWSGVVDPEQRRRIQNRIAQRKFRERTRDQREQLQREVRNKQYADSAYRTPDPTELGDHQEDEQLGGLPWGGPSMRHIVSRGYAYERRRSGAAGAGDSHLDDNDDDHDKGSSTYSRHHGSGGGDGSGGRSSDGVGHDHDVYEPTYHDYDDSDTSMPGGVMGSVSIHDSRIGHYAGPHVVRDGYSVTEYGLIATRASPGYVVADDSHAYPRQVDYTHDYDYGYTSGGGYGGH